MMRMTLPNALADFEWAAAHSERRASEMVAEAERDAAMVCALARHAARQFPEHATRLLAAAARAERFAVSARHAFGA